MSNSNRTARTFYWLTQILVFVFGASLLWIYESHNYIAAAMLLVSLAAAFFGQLSWNKAASLFSLLIVFYCLPILILYLNNMASIQYLEKPLGGLLVIPPLALLSKHPPKIKYFETGIAVGLIIIFLLCLPQIITNKYRVFLGANPIPFAMTISGMMMICLPLLNKKNISATIFAGVAIIFGMLLIGFSGTRGAYLSTMIGLLVYIILIPGKKKRYLTSGLIITAVSVFLVANINPTLQKRVNTTIDAIVDIKNGDFDSSIGSRLLLWNNGIQKGCENIWTGSGYNNQSNLEVTKSDGKIRVFDNVHNEYIDSFSARGVFGLLSTLCLLVCPLALIWKKRTKNTKLFNAALAFYLSAYINGLSSLYLWRSATWKLFLIASIVFIAIFYSKPELESEK